MAKGMGWTGRRGTAREERERGVGRGRRKGEVPGHGDGSQSSQNSHLRGQVHLVEVRVADAVPLSVSLRILHSTCIDLEPMHNPATPGQRQADGAGPAVKVEHNIALVLCKLCFLAGQGIEDFRLAGVCLEERHSRDLREKPVSPLLPQ